MLPTSAAALARIKIPLPGRLLSLVCKPPCARSDVTDLLERTLKHLRSAVPMISIGTLGTHARYHVRQYLHVHEARTATSKPRKLIL